LGLPDGGVRLLLRQLRQRGAAALAAGYQACGRHQAPRLPPLLPALLRLHQERPRRGAGRLRVELAAHSGGRALPCRRALRRWLRRPGAAPARPGRPGGEGSERGRVPHEVWQMDAVEQLALAGGQQVRWPRIADGASGAVLKAAVSPP
jgi:hypothetical protein